MGSEPLRSMRLYLYESVRGLRRYLCTVVLFVEGTLWTIKGIRRRDDTTNGERGCCDKDVAAYRQSIELCRGR